MKTIRETVFDAWGTESTIAALEAREKERDEAERERVKAALMKELCDEDGTSSLGEDIIAILYQPPKPETLPAGMYVCRYLDRSLRIVMFTETFQPAVGWEYRPIVNPFDPPPEVTGNAEPKTLVLCCYCNDTKVVKVWPGASGQGTPTEEPCSACQPLPTFEEWCEVNVKGYASDSMFFHNSPEQARTALKAALLKLGRIRE